jgi:hypothetical protein
MRAVLLALLVLLGGCFSVSFQDGTVRCSTDPDARCPVGYTCIGGYCWSRPPDGGLDAGG